MTSAITAPRGLKNVIVADTRLGDVRGEEGFFHYRNHDATTLARTASFEDVWYLMLYGRMPHEKESVDFARRVGALRAPSGAAIDVLRSTVEPGSDPLRSLRIALATLGRDETPLFDLDESERLTAALRYGAAFPTIVAAAHRLASGLNPLEPDPGASHAADYLRMATGAARAEDVAALQTYLVATIDHGFNASTFAGRVIASSGSDMASCLLGAVGAFLGPLHGGAPSRALAALEAIGDPAGTRDWVRTRIANGEKIMGFGHAVYRTHDPRSELLKQVAARYDSDLVRRATTVEREIELAINELKPGRRLYANVEFYAGVVMSEVGLAPQMFTPTFAVARAIGWTANVLEEARAGKIIRPSARYVGPPPVPGK